MRGGEEQHAGGACLGVEEAGLRHGRDVRMPQRRGTGGDARGDEVDQREAEAGAGALAAVEAAEGPAVGDRQDAREGDEDGEGSEAAGGRERRREEAGQQPLGPDRDA